MIEPRVPAMLANAQAGGYAVAAVNIIDIVTMDGVMHGAALERSPVIVQATPRTARLWGPAVIAAAYERLADRHGALSALGLDHCQDLDLVDDCLAAGWHAILFDGSALPVDENIAMTRSVVELARRHGASVEGELEAIRGQEDGLGSGGAVILGPPEDSVDFVMATDVDCFAPSIGNVHGRTSTVPTLDMERARWIAERVGVPLALHGGTGIDHATVRELISLGVAKINVSTALREACGQAIRATLDVAGDDVTMVLEAVRDAASQTTREVVRLVGSGGKASSGERYLERKRGRQRP